MKKTIICLAVLFVLTGCLRPQETYTRKEQKAEQTQEDKKPDQTDTKEQTQETENQETTEEKTTENKDQETDQDMDGKNMRTVNADGLNMRSEPSVNADVLMTIANGSKVEVLDTLMLGEKTWAKISYDGQEGYVDSSFLD